MPYTRAFLFGLAQDLRALDEAFSQAVLFVLALVAMLGGAE